MVETRGSDDRRFTCADMKGCTCGTEGMSQRTRYFERATVLVRYAVLKLIVVVQWVATTAMMADFFTKASDEETYVRCRAVIMNIEEDRKWFPSTRTSVKLKTQRLMAAITRAVKEMD